MMLEYIKRVNYRMQVTRYGNARAPRIGAIQRSRVQLKTASEESAWYYLRDKTQWNTDFIIGYRALIEKYSALLTPLEWRTIQQFYYDYSAAQGILYDSFSGNRAPWYDNVAEWTSAFNAGYNAVSFLHFRFANPGAVAAIAAKQLLLTGFVAERGRWRVLEDAINDRTGKWSYDEKTLFRIEQESYRRDPPEIPILIDEIITLQNQLNADTAIFNEYPLIFGLLFYHAHYDSNFDLSVTVRNIWYILNYGSELATAIGDAQRQSDLATQTARSQGDLAVSGAVNDGNRMLEAARQDAQALRIDLGYEIDSLIRDMQIMGLLIQGQI